MACCVATRFVCPPVNMAAKTAEGSITSTDYTVQCALCTLAKEREHLNGFE